MKKLLLIFVLLLSSFTSLYASEKGSALYSKNEICLHSMGSSLEITDNYTPNYIESTVVDCTLKFDIQFVQKNGKAFKLKGEFTVLGVDDCWDLISKILDEIGALK